jgi:hypothetical protein
MTVEVRFFGHLGNNLFQYALGRVLAEELGHALVCVAPLARPGFDRVEQASGIADQLSALADRFADVPLRLPGREVIFPQLRLVLGEQAEWHGHGINLARVLRTGHDQRIVLRGYFQRSEYYLPYRVRMRRWFHLPPVDGELRPGPRDIVVHLRRSYDMRMLDRMLSLRYYEQALDAASFDRVLVCGLGIDATTRARLARFNPAYLDLDALATLRLLQRANNIVLANSTFSWWGAWLSDAEHIWFPRPVRGIWSPERPDMALEVPEARYHYIDDVELDETPVFAPVAGARLAFDGVGTLTLDGPDGARTLFQVGAAGGPFAQWLAARRAPFGVGDFTPLNLPRAAFVRALLLLEHLRERGGIACDPALLRAYRDTWGPPRAGT